MKIESVELKNIAVRESQYPKEVLPELLNEHFPGSEKLQRIYIGIFNAD